MDFKRALVRVLKAPFASQLGVFKNPKEHVLVLSRTKIIYKLQLIREYVDSRIQIDIAPNYVYNVVYFPL